MQGLKNVLQEIIYAEILFVIVMVFTFLVLSKLLNTKHTQTTGVEAIMTVGLIMVLFGIPYIMIQTTFFIGMLIVVVISFVITGILFLLSIDLLNKKKKLTSN